MACRVYLDMCVLKRPFDDQSRPRVWLEANAVAVLLQAAETGDIALVSSEALELENGQNPWQFRRDTVTKWLGSATLRQEVTDAVEVRSAILEKSGLGGLDALHLACAEVFVTCDDRVLRRYAGELRVTTPTEYAEELQGV